MTIDELKNYRSICAEIADIKKELAGHYAGDTVQSGSKHPYSVHNVRIEGYKSDAETIKKLTRLSELNTQKDKITKFIFECPDNQMRYILHTKFIKGESNLYIAMKLGYRDETIIRRKIKKYFQKAEKADF